MLSITATPDPVVMGQDVLVTWSSTDDSTPVSGSVTRDGQPFSDQASGSQSYTVPFDAALTQITFDLNAQDAFGNSNTAQAVVAVNPPTLGVAIDTPADGFRTNLDTVTVTGTMSLEAATVSVNGVPATQTGTNWSAEVPLPTEGDHIITATASFSTAVPATDQITVTRDNTGPVLSLTATPDPVVMGQDILVTWSSADDSTPVSGSVTRDGQPFSDQASGSQSYTVPIDAALNQITFDLNAQDAFGNSNTTQMIVAVNPPELSVTITDPTDGARVGTETLTVSGTISIAAATVSVNGVPATQNDTNWTADVPLAVEGLNTIVATASFAGQTPAQAQISVIRDTTAPTLSISAAPSPVTVGQPLTVTWSSSDDSTPVSGTVTLNGEPFSDQANGEQVYAVPADAGLTELVFVLTATDALGNSDTTQTTVPVNPDLEIAITSPADGARFSDETTTITGTVNNDAVTVTVNGVTAVLTGTDWTADIPLTLEGENIVTATATLGSVPPAEAQITVVRDTTGPVMTLTATPNPITMGETLTITWSASDDSTPVTGSLTVNGAPFSDQPSGNAPFDVPVDAGLTQLELVFDAQDSFGNPNQETLIVPVNSPGLSIAITSPEEGARTDASTITVTGTVSTESAAVTVNGAPAEQTGLNWTASVNLSQEGDNTITATATFGTSVPANAMVTVVRDTQPPVMTLTATPDPVTMGQSLMVSWTAEDGSTPITGSVTLNGQPFSDQANGSSNYTVPVEVNLTQLAFEFNAQDSFGHANRETLVVAVQPIDLSVTINSPQDGFLTNTGSVALSGTVSHANSSVRVGGLDAVVDGLGWTADVPLSEDGVFQLTARATLAGFSATDSVSVEQDGTGPDLDIVAPDTIVQGETLIFRWQSEDRNDVISASMSLDGVEISTLPAGADDFEVPPAAVEPIVLTLTATDGLGNVSNAEHTVQVQTVDLQIGITTPVAGLLTNAGTVTVTGTVSDPLAIVTLNGEPATVDADTWTVDLPLTTDGEVTLTATATLDVHTAQAVRTITYDGTPPVLAITAGDTVTQGQTLDFSWTASDNLALDWVEMRRGVTPVSTDPVGSGSFTVPYDNGLTTIVLTLEAADTAGNRHLITETITVIPVELTVTITSPEPNSLTNADNLTLSGTITPAGTPVSVRGVPAQVTAGDWTVTVPLAGEGDISLLAEAVLESNRTTDSLTVVRDITPPVIDFTAPETRIQGDNFDYSWTITDTHALGPVSISLDGNVVGDTATGTLNHAIPIDSLEPVVFNIIARDELGNEATLTHTVVVQPAAVQVTITNPDTGLITNGDTVTVSGTVSDAAATVLLNGFETTQDGVNWTIDLPLDAEGEIPLTAEATLGSTTASATRNLIRDITAPVVTVNAPLSVLQTERLNFDWLAVDENGIASASLTRDGIEIATVAEGLDFWLTPYDPALVQVTLQLSATDYAGNSDTATAVVNIQQLDLGLNLISADSQSPTDGRWINGESQAYLLEAATHVTSLDVVSVSLGPDPVSIPLNPDQTADWLMQNLSEGTHQFSFNWYGPGGSTGSVPLTLNIDRTAPTLNWSPADQAGFGKQVNFAALLADDASGLAARQIFDDLGREVLDDGTSDPSWTWTAPNEGLLWTVRLRAYDVAGNLLSVDHDLALTSDFFLTITPVNNAPTDGTWVNSARLDYIITVGIDVETVDVTIDGATNPLTLTDGQASFSHAEEGSFQAGFDYSGNGQTGSAILPLNIDRTDPTFEWTTLPLFVDASTATDLAAAIADDASGITTYLISDTQAGNADIDQASGLLPAWTWTSPAENGFWLIDYTITDAAGNTLNDQTSLPVGVDPSAPFSIAWDEPTPGLVTAGTSVAVAGRILEGIPATAFVNGTALNLTAAGFSGTVNLADEGLTWLNLEVTGANGKTIRRQRQLIVDRTAPVINLEGGTAQRGTGNTLTLRGALFDTWDAAPVLTVAGRPELGSQVSEFELSNLPSDDFPLTLTATDHVGNSADLTVTWNPDPAAGVLVTLNATPTAAPVGSSVTLTARASAQGDSPVKLIQLFRMDGETETQIATVNNDLLLHEYPIPNRSELASITFLARAETQDGSSNQVPLVVPVAGDLLLEGYVFDATTGHPVAGASVQLENAGVTLTTDADGYYRTWQTVPVPRITVSAGGYLNVQLEGPFLPGEVRLLPDARLTQPGATAGGTVVPVGADALAASANQQVYDNLHSGLTRRTQLTVNGSPSLTTFSDQALPLLLPLGWRPHTVFHIDSGSASWTGPAATGSHLVSFAHGETGWRIDDHGNANWMVPVTAGRVYAWVFPDVATADQTPGNLLTVLPEAVAGQADGSGLSVEADPPFSVARSGISALAVFKHDNLQSWSGTRVLMRRSETYRKENPTEGETAIRTIPQQAVLYKRADGRGNAHLPLVPRRDDLLATIHSATIGGPAEGVSADPGVWVTGSATIEVRAGMNLTAGGTEKFWLRAEAADTGSVSFPDWTLGEGFRLSIEDRGTPPSLSLDLDGYSLADAGRVALFYTEPNTLGARHRLMGLLDASGSIPLLPGRSWLDGDYFLVTSQLPMILGSISLDPNTAGDIRVRDSLLGDRLALGESGWLVLPPGVHFLDGLAENLSTGALTLELTGNESGTQNWVVPTASPALRLSGSLPASGENIGLAPQFMLQFSYPVDLTSVAPETLIARVNGTQRVMEWQWELGEERVLGNLATLIQDETNDDLAPGDTFTIEGTAGITAQNGLALEPFQLTYSVPLDAEPAPLAPENLYMVYNPTNNSVFIRATAPVGPVGTFISLFNTHNGASGNFSQLPDTSAMEIELAARKLDPIEVELTSPHGRTATITLTLYYETAPTDDLIAFTAGPRGGTFELPGAGTFTLPPGALEQEREVRFERWTQPEPDISANPGVTTELWLIDGLANEYTVAEMTWDPDITYDQDGNPTNMKLLSQPLPFMPQWWREQTAGVGLDEIQRPLVDLASPVIQNRNTEIPVRFVGHASLGEPPPGFSKANGKLLAFAWGMASFLLEQRVAMAVSTILISGSGEGRGIVKFGQVGAFEYKDEVVEGFGTLHAEEGNLIQGAWVMGFPFQTPVNDIARLEEGSVEVEPPPSQDPPETSIISGNAQGDTEVEVSIGTIPPGESATISFVTDVPEGVNFIDMTAHTEGPNGKEPVLDANDVPDPEPAYYAVKTFELEEDQDGDGIIDAGDKVRHIVTIKNNSDEPVYGISYSGYVASNTSNQRQYPLNIAPTDSEGKYWASSAWWFPEDQRVFGWPHFANHPSFSFLARKIFFADFANGTIPHQIAGAMQPEAWYHRDFGFWYVDPDGGIGTSRPPGLGLEFVKANVYKDGERDPVLSLNFELDGKVPEGLPYELVWEVKDRSDLEHVAIARLDGAPLSADPQEVGENKTLKIRANSGLPGSHQMKVTVRNPFGFEMYASFAYLTLPNTGGDDGIVPTSRAPFIIGSGVQPEPVNNEGVNETNQGLILEGELIYIPFSEPMIAPSADALKAQFELRVGQLGVPGAGNLWPVEFLTPEGLEDVAAGTGLKGLYLKPIGVLPPDHSLKLKVTAGDGITDTTGVKLPPDEELDEGLHYQADWITLPGGAEVQDFTKRLLVDYATWGKYLFELSIASEGGPEVVIYEKRDTGKLIKKHVIPVRETKEPSWSFLNAGARTVEFWHNPSAGPIPGYILVGYSIVNRVYGGQTQVMRPARMKMFNPNKKGLEALAGGFAVGNTQSDRVRQMIVNDGVVWINTVWGGVSVVDLTDLLVYYQQGIGRRFLQADNTERPPFSTVQGVNQPASALKERYFPFVYPPEFFIGGAIGTPVEIALGTGPREFDPNDREKILWGTGGIELGAWYHGDPPLRILLSGYDAGYSPFDPQGETRYDTAAERLKNWDIDGDRKDDRLTYFSENDIFLNSDSGGGDQTGSDTCPPQLSKLLGRGGLPSEFDPIFIGIVPQVQTELMRGFDQDPMDIAVMRTNPADGKEGGLMFAGLERRDDVTYFAFMLFDRPIKDIEVHPDRQEVAAMSADGRLIVIDVTAWVDLGLQYKNNPCDPALVELDSKLTQPVKQGDFIPGLVADIDIDNPKNFTMAFMGDRIVMGSNARQKQVILTPPLFINPGFELNKNSTRRVRNGTLEIISQSAPDNEDEIRVDLGFSLREDAHVVLQLLDDDDKVISEPWSMDNMDSGHGVHVHRITFPLSKVGLSPKSVSEGGIPLAIKRKMRLVGRPVKRLDDKETVRLSLEVQTDPWGTGLNELNSFNQTEPWSGRINLTEDPDVPFLPAPGIPLTVARRYVSQGIWNGSLGQGWYLPWEAQVLWTVDKDAPGTSEWMEIRFPDGEVIPASKDTIWEIDFERFDGNVYHDINAELEADDFPEKLDLEWGSDKLEFTLVKCWAGGGFGPDEFVYTKNPGDEAWPKTVLTARYILTEWTRDVGGSFEGWTFENEEDRITRAESTAGTHEITMEYVEHSGTGRMGLEQVDVNSLIGDLEGGATVKFKQDEENEDALVLLSARSDLYGWGDFEYAYEKKSLGVSGGQNIEIVTFLMNSRKGMLDETTSFTHDKQSEQSSLPDGYSWPYLTTYDNSGYTREDWTYTWHTAPGRTATATMTDTLGGQAEEYEWTFESGPRAFNLELTRNGHTMFTDWAGWPSDITRIMPGGIRATTSVDDLFRVTQVVNRADDGTPIDSPQFDYNGSSRLVAQIRHTDGRIEHFKYDSLGRPVNYKDGLGGITAVPAYIGSSTLASMSIDETQTRTNYGYDAFGRMTRYERLDYTLETTYNPNGKKTTGSGKNGLSFRETGSYTKTGSGMIVNTSMTDLTGFTPSIQTISEYDQWHRLKSVKRAGITLMQVNQYHMGGPQEQIVGWNVQNQTLVTEYVDNPGAVGFVPKGQTLGGVRLWSAIADPYGRYTVYKDSTRGLFTDTGFNAIGDPVSIINYNLDGGGRGTMLETTQIGYGSLNGQTVNRNGQTYSVQYSPGPTWSRVISGDFGRVEESGSGEAIFTISGKVQGEQVFRKITRQAGKETIQQRQNPTSLVKELSGDGRTLSVTSNGQKLVQQFTGIGEVKQTRTEAFQNVHGQALFGLTLYQLQKTNAHRQQLQWYAGGQTFNSTYDRGRLVSQSTDGVQVMQVTGWETLGRPSGFNTFGVPHSVSYLHGQRQKIITQQAGSEGQGSRITVTYDGLGRARSKVMEDLAGESDPLEWRWEYGQGFGPAPGAPGDRLIQAVSPIDILDYSYGPDGSLLFVKDLRGNLSKNEPKTWGITHETVEDDPRGELRLTTVNGPEDTEITNLYDPAGRLLEKHRNGQLVLTNEYDNRGRLVRTTNLQGVVTTRRYQGESANPSEEIVRAVDQEYINLMTYDGAGNLATLRSRIQRDQDGVLTGGIWWRYTYDDGGRQIKVERGVDGANYQNWRQVEYNFDPDRPKDQRITGPDGVTWTLKFNRENGRLEQRFNDADQVMENWQFLDAGRRIIYNRDNSYYVAFENDFAGRTTLRSVYDHADAEMRTFQRDWTYRYEDHAVPVHEEHPDGTVVERLFTPSGKPETITYKQGVDDTEPYRIDMIYDDLERVKQISTNKNQSADFTYTSFGRLASETWSLSSFPGTLTTSYSYDDRGNQTGVLYPSGRSVQRVFDRAGKIQGIYEAGQLQAGYRYDTLGRLTQINRAGAVIDYSYDALSRLTEHRLTTNGDHPSTRIERFGYAPLPGSQEDPCDPSDVDLNGHPDAIRCHTLQWGEVYLEEYFKYNDLGMIASQRIADAAHIPGLNPGTEVTYHYNSLRSLERISTPIGDMVHTYNPDGSLKDKQFNGYRMQFGYDAAGRLTNETEFTSADAPTGFGRTLNYDRGGRLTDISETGPGQEHQQEFEYDPLGRMRASRNASAQQTGWNVFTLSPAMGADLPIPMAGGPRTQEVLLTTETTRGVPQVLGFAYGPDGLSHVSAQPVTNWTHGSIAPQVADPFQNLVASLEPFGMQTPPPTSGSDVVMANFWDVWGDGVTLETSKVFDTTGVNPPAPTHMMGATWEVDPTELGFGLPADNTGKEGEEAWTNQYMHALMPGFSGKTHVGGYLDLEGADSSRATATGLPDTPVGSFANMGTRLYNPAMHQFAAADSWGMFDTTGDHFTANRYLYANANPVMFGDMDGRLASLKQAMAYTDHGGGVRDIAFAMTQREKAALAGEILEGITNIRQLFQMQLVAIGALLADAVGLDQIAGILDTILFVEHIFRGDIDGQDLLDMITVETLIEMAADAAIDYVLPAPGIRPDVLEERVDEIRGMWDEMVLEGINVAYLGTQANMELPGYALTILTSGGNLDHAVGDGMGLEAQRLGTRALMANQGFCFAAGTPVETPMGLRPIERIEVGQRVISVREKKDAAEKEGDDDDPDPDPAGYETQRGGPRENLPDFTTAGRDTNVDPATWRLVSLSMPRRDNPSAAIEIQTLKPISWLQLLDVKPGNWVYLKLDDMDLEGRAIVKSVEACPPIMPGPGKVVLSTFTTDAADLIQLNLADGNLLELTPRHRIFSIDRNAYVPAVYLQEGERVRTLDGHTRISNISRLLDMRTVHNLEVEDDHAYYASRARVLGHNASAGGRVVRGGRHRHTKKQGKKHGTESHHLVSDAISVFAYNDAPALRMDVQDHYLTASHGRRGKKGAAFRKRQERMVQNGEFDRALAYGVKDVRRKFGNKYDDAINDMYDSLPKAADGSIEWDKIRRQDPVERREKKRLARERKKLRQQQRAQQQ
ncbi:MAG: hypothetical protein QNK37_21730 [Acidobacteriota bacterium]|nr:hypothetical protein [Acidobacteriota bacterium]